MPSIRIRMTMILIAALLLSTASSRAHPSPRPLADDFSGDPYDDIFVGVPEETLSEGEDAGYVNVFYGHFAAISTINTQGWDQSAATEMPNAAANEKFGSALASGDFNGDRRMDLAIGAPLEDIGSHVDAGSVTVLFGTAGGLSSYDAYFFRQGIGGVTGNPQTDEHFGHSLAAGDFNRDGFSDLAIGAPNDYVMLARDCGSVHVLYGSREGFLPLRQSNLNPVAHTGECELDDQFGFALAPGDFDGDSYIDLAIGVPGKENDDVISAGGVYIAQGSSAGLENSGFTHWEQGTSPINDPPESVDAFGSVLAGGDFDGDHVDDLVIGVPYEDINGLSSAGLVHVLYHCLDYPATIVQTFQQGAAGVEEVLENDDLFGYALTAADFNADGRDDLAIGAPYESYGAYIKTGVVQVLYGGSAGLRSDNDQVWAQNVAGLQGPPESNNLFGYALAAGRINADPYFDLVIGVPLDYIGGVAGGGIQVIYGSAAGLPNTGTLNPHYLSQDGAAVPGDVELMDYFGASLATSYCPNCRYPVYLPLTTR